MAKHVLGLAEASPRRSLDRAGDCFTSGACRKALSARGGRLLDLRCQRAGKARRERRISMLSPELPCPRNSPGISCPGISRNLQTSLCTGVKETIDRNI